MFTKEFWVDYALERALKTVAQAALAFIGTGSMGKSMASHLWKAG